MNYRLSHYPDSGLATVTTILWYTPLSLQQQDKINEVIERAIDNNSTCEDEIVNLESQLTELETELESLSADNDVMGIQVKRIRHAMPKSLIDITYGDAMKALETIRDALETTSE